MLGNAYTGEAPDLLEWEPAYCEPLTGHTNDIAWDGPETIALGYSSSLHDNTKATRDNEE
jgi:hypothetical protein